MSAMTASTPYSGSPILVVMDMALTVAEDEAAALVVELARVDDTVLAVVLAVVLASVDETTALVVAADTVVADTVVAADTVVDEITLVSISYHSVNVNSRNEICVFGH